MSEIEKIKRHIERTDIRKDMQKKYSLRYDAIIALSKQDVFEAICLAFDYGRAKGYRMAKAEVQG